MKRGRKPKVVQTEFPFIGERRALFSQRPPNLPDLGRLPASVLNVGTRARKWLKAHQIRTLDQLVEAEKNKTVSGKCLDQQVRKEIQRQLGLFWEGKKYRYLFALNFLDKGVEKILSNNKQRQLPLSGLRLSLPLRQALEEKKIATIGDLLLQAELKWRNPRVFGNILVEEILAALDLFLEEKNRA
jgi:DNA-directed RNA polymerase alpha subunit